MPIDSGSIASQTGASGGLWTHTPVDWEGNEGVVKPAGWPTDASLAIPPNGARTSLAPGEAPSLTAISVTGITSVGATINFTVQPSSSSVVEWGMTTAYGLASPPIVASGARTYAIGSLTTATVYHYRIHSTANNQTTYSSDRTFTTT